MEVTPQNRILRQRHTPTPKMYDRKKSLFSSANKSSIPATIDEDADLGPMSPLQFSSSPTSYDNSRSSDNNRTRFMQNANYRTDFQNVIRQLSPTNSSDTSLPATPKSHRKTPKTKQSPATRIDQLEKENSPLKTPHDLNTSSEMPRKSSRRSLILNAEATPESDMTPNSKRYRKRVEIDSAGDKTKPTTNAKTSLQFTGPQVISAQSFYSSTYNETEKIHMPHFNPVRIVQPSQKKVAKKARPIRRPVLGNINRGVGHKVFKPKVTRKEPFKSMTKSQLLDMANQIIEKSSLNGYFNKLRMQSKQQEKSPTTANDENAVTNAQISKLKQILTERQHYFDAGYQLNWNINGNATSTAPGQVEHKHNYKNDHQNDEDDDDDEGEENLNRKFFKSKRSSTKGSYKLTDRLSATVKRGSKLKLNSPKKKKSKMFDASYDEFLSIQSEVSKIVQMLEADRSVLNNSFESTTTESTEIAVIESGNTNDNPANETTTENESIQKYQRFRDKILSISDNSELLEKHNNQLDFLISYDICTEENFKIFILEPEQHTTEIEQILNQLIVVDDSVESTMGDETEIVEPTLADTLVNIEPLYSDVPMSPTSQISNMTSGLVLDCAYQKEGTTHAKTDDARKFYPLFYKNTNVINSANDCPLADGVKKHFKWKPIGNNQLIIDAGQKEFGPKICHQCDMFYTRHDPDDERMHERYHNQRVELHFKGWAEENVAQEVPEWGVDGRIIIITRHDTKTKRKRVDEILNKVIHYELGCTGITWKPMTMIFLAVAKKHVIGVCVVELVKEAYRAVYENGIPSIQLNQKIPVKCGISRLWVGEPYRRTGIASGFIQLIRTRYIPGYVIALDEIAFSSPTEAGLKFAERIMKTVLVYDAL